MKDIDEENIFQMMTVNHQNIFLFEGTVKDNITLFQEWDDNQLHDSLVKSGVVTFLCDLKDGIHTYVGENGNKLSGGQRQRIALARAFLHKRPIMIIDEGTSAIDWKASFEIEKALLDDNDLTLITITHRLSSELLSKYDKVIILENGVIKGMNSYENIVQGDELSEFFNL